MRSNPDLERLVYALARVSDGMRRAQRHTLDPTRQAILHTAAGKDTVRPSDIAHDLGIHQSSVGRQAQALEDLGQVALNADPADRRSCLISLTDEGWAEIRRLSQLGMDAFSEFVDGWPDEDVRSLADLLERLEGSVAAAKQRRQKPSGRRWQKRAEQ